MSKLPVPLIIVLIGVVISVLPGRGQQARSSSAAAAQGPASSGDQPPQLFAQQLRDLLQQGSGPRVSRFCLQILACDRLSCSI